MIVAVPKYARLGQGFNKREVLASKIHPGRNTKIKGYQSPASWIMDLVSIRKPVLLCTFCRSHFIPKDYCYRRFFTPDVSGKTSGFVTNGQCDACKQDTANFGGGGVMFVPEEVYHLTCVDPSEMRRRARQAWRGSTTAWQQIKKARERT